MPIQIPITFINKPTQDFYESQARHACICGGFGSGKTFVMANKAITLLTQFNNYRVLFARLKYSVLKETTMKTFFKICPPQLYDPNQGGRRSDLEGYLKLVNGSEVKFIHLDDFDEDFLRGIELNSAFLDQAEELPEGIVDILDTRLGRWDRAIPVDALLMQYPDWPRNDVGCYEVPAYLGMTVNPEDETHWVYRKYHPDSLEHRTNYPDYAYFEVSSEDNPYLPAETLKVMKSRDPQWVKRFVEGKWGISEATVHRLLPDSIIDPPREWIENLLKKATLFRSFDHGESAPTCCTWWASHNKQYFGFREYYECSPLISQHRREIASLSGDETYNYSVADPSIFKKESKRFGGFWSVADEYSEVHPDSPPAIHFIPGDNNELATRNRINEYLQLHENQKHPLTGESPAPQIYFIKRNPSVHSYGMDKTLIELRAQKRIKLATLNGKDIFGEEREKSVPDHSYDTVRYFVASHAGFPNAQIRRPPARSFEAVRKNLRALKSSGLYSSYGDFVPRSNLRG